MILKGKIALRLGPDEHQLATGDAVTLLPGERRLWVNTGRAPAQVLIVGLQFV